MRITGLRLQSFRNHSNSELELGDGTNVLLGDNGQGKTNILEAISYLCLTKSFYASTDSVVLTFDKEFFEIEGTAALENGQENQVRVVYDKRIPQKAFFINRRSIEPFSSVIGKFPVVICSPEHAPITTGSPGERRKFVDLLISQSDNAYFKTLIEYRHVLKQRNKILFDAKLNGNDVTPLIEPWNEQLANLGGFLMSRRKAFVGAFRPFLNSSYSSLAGERENPQIEYLPTSATAEASTEAEFQGMLQSLIRDKVAEERRVGTSLAGPHRDEFAFMIDGLDMRKYASQGQHKTFLVALKLAEFFYLKERCAETPILLLDDIFSELDELRSEGLLNFVGGISQTFITSTGVQFLERAIEFGERNRKFSIEKGCVKSHKVLALS